MVNKTKGNSKGSNSKSGQNSKGYEKGTNGKNTSGKSSSSKSSRNSNNRTNRQQHASGTKQGEGYWAQRSAQRHEEKLAKTDARIANAQDRGKTARTAARSAAAAQAATAYANNMNGGFVIGPNVQPEPKVTDNSGGNDGQDSSGSEGKTDQSGNYQKA